VLAFFPMRAVCAKAVTLALSPPAWLTVLGGQSQKTASKEGMKTRSMQGLAPVFSKFQSHTAPMKNSPEGLLICGWACGRWPIALARLAWPVKRWPVSRWRTGRL
jgi:hypothetical protein